MSEGLGPFGKGKGFGGGLSHALSGVKDRIAQVGIVGLCKLLQWDALVPGLQTERLGLCLRLRAGHHLGEGKAERFGVDQTEVAVERAVHLDGLWGHGGDKFPGVLEGGGKGKKVGLVGFGGLGQMAVKIAKAMEVDSVTVLSRDDKKREDAERLGCEYIVYSNKEEVTRATRSFDVILDTVSAPHDVGSLIITIKVGGTYVLVGGVVKPFEISAMKLISHQHAMEGSLIGGVPETQQMLDFCALHKIVPEYKVIAAKDADAHFQSMDKGFSGAIRAVIDMSTLKDLTPVPFTVAGKKRPASDV